MYGFWMAVRTGIGDKRIFVLEWLSDLVEMCFTLGLFTYFDTYYSFIALGIHPALNSVFVLFAGNCTEHWQPAQIKNHTERSDTMIKQKIFLALLLLALTALPAFAGKVTARNYTAKNAYYVEWDTWDFGIKGGNSICVKPGEKAVVNRVFTSIGKIEVYPSVCNDCSCKTYIAIKLLKKYIPSGVFLPHRTFTVTIESGGTIQIDED